MDLTSVAVKIVTDLNDGRLFKYFVGHQCHVELTVAHQSELFFVKTFSKAVKLLGWVILVGVTFVSDKVRQCWPYFPRPLYVMPIQFVNLRNLLFTSCHPFENLEVSLPIRLSKPFEVRRNQVQQVQVSF